MFKCELLTSTFAFHFPVAYAKLYLTALRHTYYINRIHCAIHTVLESSMNGSMHDMGLDVLVAVLDRDMRWPCFWDLQDSAHLRSQQQLPEFKCVVLRNTKCY